MLDFRRVVTRYDVVSTLCETGAWTVAGALADGAVGTRFTVSLRARRAADAVGLRRLPLARRPRTGVPCPHGRRR